MHGMMEQVHSLLLKRNSVETKPFDSVHASNAALQNLVDALQTKCDALERECALQQEQLLELAVNENNNGGKGSNPGIQKGSTSSAAAAAALKSEARLREKLEKVQEELHFKMKSHADDTERALATQRDLANMKDLNTAQGKIISDLKDQHEKSEARLEMITHQLKESQSRTDLAEQQYMGLKDTIRTLQDENDGLQKENAKLVKRIVSEKEKVMDEVKVLNTTVEKYRAELEMMRTLQKQEKQRNNNKNNKTSPTKPPMSPAKSWFGKIVGSEVNTPKKQEKEKEESRKWGSMNVVIPSEPKHTIQAHSLEATCVRYDSTGQTDMVATSGHESTVKVWDTGSGALKATLRGGSGHTIVSCDIGGGLVVGGGSDKTCRVWNLKTERMIHQLVGHGNKITCVRLVNGEKAVLSGSADRSMKLWDISRNTYRQTTTLRYSSIANCIDVGPDCCTAVSGHVDGNLLFWDLRSGNRTTEIPNLHGGQGITSVQFHPTDTSQLLTNGKDCKLCVVDVRTCKTIHELEHDDFKTSLTYSSCCFSPDGMYAVAGSNSCGDLFVWRVVDGSLNARVKAHANGVGGIAWGRGGTNGQQVASVDRKGSLILWA